MTVLSLRAALILAALWPPVTSVAQPPTRNSGPTTAQAVDLSTIGATLTDGDPEAASAGLKALQAHPDANAASAALASALRSGVPSELLEPALRTLAHTGGEHAVRTLSAFAHHRRVVARVASLAGLSALRAPGVRSLLEDGLRDSDPRVRAVSARMLGKLEARESTELLLHALARGVPEAARAIGQVGDAHAIAPYGKLLQRAPLAVMLSGYKAFLTRTDLPESAKLTIVAQLEEVASPPVKRFLQAHLVGTDLQREPRLRSAIAGAIERIADPPAVPGAQKPAATGETP